MSDQLDLFEDNKPKDKKPDKEPAASIKRVARGNEDWIEAVLDIVRQIETEFTTDYLWERVKHLPKPRDNRAMGAAMTKAADIGLVENTRTQIKSTRRECHSRPVTIWRPIKRT